MYINPSEVSFEICWLPVDYQHIIYFNYIPHSCNLRLKCLHQSLVAHANIRRQIPHMLTHVTKRAQKRDTMPNILFDLDPSWRIKNCSNFRTGTTVVLEIQEHRGVCQSKKRDQFENKTSDTRGLIYCNLSLKCVLIDIVEFIETDAHKWGKDKLLLCYCLSFWSTCYRILD